MDIKKLLKNKAQAYKDAAMFLENRYINDKYKIEANKQAAKEMRSQAFLIEQFSELEHTEHDNEVAYHSFSE